MLKLEELFSKPELIPEVPGDLGNRLPRALQDLIDVTQQRAVEVLGAQPRERLVLFCHNLVVQARVVENRVDERRNLQRILR